MDCAIPAAIKGQLFGIEFIRGKLKHQKGEISFRNDCYYHKQVQYNAIKSPYKGAFIPRKGRSTALLSHLFRRLAYACHFI